MKPEDIGLSSKKPFYTRKELVERGLFSGSELANKWKEYGVKYNVWPFKKNPKSKTGPHWYFTKDVVKLFERIQAETVCSLSSGVKK